MAVKTYWRAKPDGSWEFLGAWPEDHVADDESGFVFGSALVHPDLEDVKAAAKRMGKRVTLSSLPTSIKKHLMTERESVVPFEQLDGYLK
jgi:hypothetical protein